MIEITEKIKSLISKLPHSSGVYLMKNKNNEIIYVGKAVSLRNRVRQYFQSQNNMQEKVKAMVSHIEEFEYIVTDSEMEALILENNLIKEYKPPYNILLRDDKTYPYIKITLNEDYPRVLKTRKVEKDGAKYFGPYSNAFIVNDIIDLIHSTFKLRTCSRNIQKSIEKKERPCLSYYINICNGPCLGIVDKNEYDNTIVEVINFLESKSDVVIESLRQKMYDASKKLDYEKAMMYRDKINGMQEMLEKQKIVSTNSFMDKDFLAVEQGDDIYCVFIFFVRGGKVVGTENFIFDIDFNKDESEVLSSFVKQYYINSAYIPKEIYVSHEFEDMDVLAQLLSKKKESKVSVKLPIKGDKKDMIQLVKKNAAETISRKEAVDKTKKDNMDLIMKQLKDILSLKTEIHKIESYDISNIQGVDSVGGQVVFVDGKKAPKLYRRYKVKTVVGPDDYSSLEEILSRRIKHEDLPDLILLDGGKGQVSVIRKLFEREKISIPVFGMYKDDKHTTMGLCSDMDLFELNRHSKLYKFIASIQEEVHRFAIDYHRSLRNKKISFSKLDNIKGIGEKRKKTLLSHFKSINNIKNASIEELEKVVDKKSALSIYEYFKYQ
ncbi:excinuclease ABC, C subunit [[Eubacterium] yurii subsp. margaretiae ATCC 43715]|nr:excinuclease ABC, C subunit [[Eubacterium] yurii subsp. margaretiae ATCC 43715]